MNLSGNSEKKQKAVTISKENGHTGGARERNGNNFGKAEFRSKVPTQAFKNGYDNIDWSKK